MSLWAGRSQDGGQGVPCWKHRRRHLTWPGAQKRLPGVALVGQNRGVRGEVSQGGGRHSLNQTRGEELGTARRGGCGSHGGSEQARWGKGSAAARPRLTADPLEEGLSRTQPQSCCEGQRSSHLAMGWGVSSQGKGRTTPWLQLPPIFWPLTKLLHQPRPPAREPGAPPRSPGSSGRCSGG